MALSRETNAIPKAERGRGRVVGSEKKVAEEGSAEVTTAEDVIAPAEEESGPGREECLNPGPTAALVWCVGAFRLDEAAMPVRDVGVPLDGPTEAKDPE